MARAKKSESDPTADELAERQRQARDDARAAVAPQHAGGGLADVTVKDTAQGSS